MHEMKLKCLLCSVWALADFWAWKVNVLAVALWGIQFFWLKFLSTVALNIQVTACPVHERRGLFPFFWDTYDARCFSLVHLEISFFLVFVSRSKFQIYISSVRSSIPSFVRPGHCLWNLGRALTSHRYEWRGWTLSPIGHKELKNFPALWGSKASQHFTNSAVTARYHSESENLLDFRHLYHEKKKEPRDRKKILDQISRVEW